MLTMKKQQQYFNIAKQLEEVENKLSSIEYIWIINTFRIIDVTLKKIYHYYLQQQQKTWNFVE